jgi:hypothetical protein
MEPKMNSFERQAFVAPPLSPFFVLSRYGRAGKFKVRAFGKDRIMTREQVIKYAQSTKLMGGAVSLGGLIRDDEVPWLKQS